MSYSYTTWQIIKLSNNIQQPPRWHCPKSSHSPPFSVLLSPHHISPNSNFPACWENCLFMYLLLWSWVVVCWQPPRELVTQLEIAICYELVNIYYIGIFIGCGSWWKPPISPYFPAWGSLNTPVWGYSTVRNHQLILIWATMSILCLYLSYNVSSVGFISDL